MNCVYGLCGRIEFSIILREFIHNVMFFRLEFSLKEVIMLIKYWLMFVSLTEQ